MNVHVASHATGLALYLRDVDDILLSMHVDYFAYLVTFIVSSNVLALMVLSDEHGADTVLLPQLPGELDHRIFCACVRRGLKWRLSFSCYLRSGRG